MRDKDGTVHDLVYATSLGHAERVAAAIVLEPGQRVELVDATSGEARGES